jgi:prepilin-type N-terminal cleavage/methylation domain-containing protein
MRENKGFTLIELLASLVILAIILAIAVPGITGIIENSTRGAFQSDAKMVLVAINYQKQRDDNFDETSVNAENIDDVLGLSNENYQTLTVEIKDTKLNITIVGKNKWDGYIAYGTMDNMRVVKSGDYDVTPPVITLLGNSTVTIEVGSTYTDAGATATDNHDGNITSNIVIDNKVNPSTVGTYTVTYNVKDNAGNSATPVIRTVNVVSTQKPVITLLGSNPVNLNQGGTYTDAGATNG